MDQGQAGQGGGGIGGWAEQAWSGFLSTLEKIIVPDWNDVIGVLPILLILGLLGPILSLLALAWTWHILRRRRGRVRLGEPQPVAAEVDETGTYIVPANTPFCARDGILYPPTATRCEICRDELVVRCPVDGTTRVATEQLCRACGTRYVLGAGATGVAIQRRSGPPAGGASVA